jgi:hypothetical protein
LDDVDETTAGEHAGDVARSSPLEQFR